MNNKCKKKMSLYLIIIAFVLGIGAGKTAFAASFENPSSKGIESSNVSSQIYDISAEKLKSYLYQNEDGTYNRVEVIGKYIYSEIYSADFKFQSQKKTKAELPIIGGVYIREDGYFVIEGKKNPDAVSDTTEFRIIKYDKNWEKLVSTNLKDMNTTTPFNAGSCRFIEDNGMLYIRTCHKMYDEHQASVMIKLDMSNCKVLTADCDVANDSVGYVSHSFNQFLDCKDGVVYACDHGDGYPRGIAMMRFDLLAEGREYFNNDVVSALPFPFSGKTSWNYTGATLGGFGVSSTHAIAVGGSVLQDGTLDKHTVSNIYVTTTDLNNFSSEGGSLVWLTDYKSSGKRTASTPQMVKVNSDRFFVIWEEYYKEEFDRTCYAVIDGTGKKIVGIRNVKAHLSDCQPILCGDKIVWYVTEKSAPVFYQMPADGSAVPVMKEGETFTKGGLKYKIIKKTANRVGEVSVVGYDKSTVPGTLDFDGTLLYDGSSYTVTEIDAKAFYKCTKIKIVYFSASVTKIGANAFCGCKKLKSIQLCYKKYSTKNVGKNAFKNIASNALIITPAGKKEAYQKLLQKRGVPKKANVIDLNTAFYL